MQGLMMDRPLLISGLIEHAARNHGDTEIVSRLPTGATHRYDYGAARSRALRLARSLLARGVGTGDRIGTLAWNTHRHFELYYAVSGIGAITHTINPRLFPDQIAYIINHAEDRYIFFDIGFASLVANLAPRCPSVRGWIALCDAGEMPECPVAGLDAYEDLLATEDADFEWPSFDENTASSLCYTSGTTGNPKGVLYSHRSTVLHAYASSLPDALGVSACDSVVPVVPMFHVNAWGLPYACAMAGARLVMPGPQLDGASLHQLFEQEGVTLSAGVPTIWLGLLQHMQAQGLRLSTVRRLVIGGSAAPPSMIEAFDAQFGVTVLHAWGMTEMSPLGTMNQPKQKHLAADESVRRHVRIKQGRALAGIEMKIVDGDGLSLPHDGVAFGNLMVRGPWVTCGYFRGEGGDVLVDGWFPTGDVATIDADGYMQITDRSKDVIKSGGEWISSIELENIAVAHPDVAEAAVIGAPHPKWDERPLLVVVRRPGARVDGEALIRFYDGKVARWWIPDAVVFVDDLPHTATGKLSKLQLRERLRDFRFGDA